MKRYTNPVCNYNKECCFRTVFGDCPILNDTKFKDNECHFRKASLYGKNLYDAARKEKEE